MSHRNNNLVFTDIDMENKRARDDDEQPDIRRSKRLANRDKKIDDILNDNCVMKKSSPKKNYVITNSDDEDESSKIQQETDAQAPLASERQRIGENELMEISSSNSEDESLNSNDTEQDSDDDVMSEETKNFIVEDEPSGPILDVEVPPGTSDPNKRKLSRDGKHVLKSLFGRGISDPVDEIGETYDELMGEEWFRQLTEDKKKDYVTKMLAIQQPSAKIPTVGEILDFDMSREYKKELLSKRYEIERLDRLSMEYDDACEKLLKQIRYFKDPERMKNEEEITKAKNDIMTQDKFSYSLKDRILSSKFDNKTKALIYDKYIVMENSTGDDVAKLREWIETVLSVPQKSNDSTQNSLNNEQISKMISDTMIALDKKVYGMIAAKEEFLCMLTNIIGNPKSKNKAIGLYGPPGIGKTLLAMIISDVLKKPMTKISLGGITDSSFLEGHGYTYIGSQPGCIAKAVIQMGCTDGIIYLDEIDKISKSEHGKEIEHALLHITDFTQNHDFRDKYMPEISIDLSQCIFIYSLNSSEEMDSALVSRIPIIKFDGYNNKEKMIILQNYMLPELLNNYGMKSGDIVIPHEVASHLINNVKEVDANSDKSGVRSLKNVLSSIFNRINLYRLGSVNGQLSVKLSFTIKNFKMPYILDLDLVNSVLSNYDDNSWKNSYGHLYL